MILCPWASGRSFVVDPHCLFGHSLWTTLKCPLNWPISFPTILIETVRFSSFIDSIFNKDNPRQSDIATWQAWRRKRLESILFHNKPCTDTIKCLLSTSKWVDNNNDAVWHKFLQVRGYSKFCLNSFQNSNDIWGAAPEKKVKKYNWKQLVVSLNKSAACYRDPNGWGNTITIDRQHYPTAALDC